MERQLKSGGRDSYSTCRVVALNGHEHELERGRGKRIHGGIDLLV